MQKRILIYGEGWDGAFANLLQSELIGRGFIVEIFDFTLIMPGIRNRSMLPRIKRRLFYSIFHQKIQTSLITLAIKFLPHVLIVSKGINIDLDTLKWFSSNGIQTVNWNPDDFFNKKNSSCNLINSLSEYDHIISPRPHLFKKYYDFGAKSIHFIDWYYVPNFHFDRKLQKNIEISFVGVWSPFREKFLAALDLNIVVYGDGWGRSSSSFRTNNLVYPFNVSQVEMSSIFNRSLININILTPENSDISNLRFFEVPASGGLLATPKNDHSRSFFTNTENALLYSSPEDLSTLISTYDRSALIQMANDGNSIITSSGCAFSNRIDSLLSALCL